MAYTYRARYLERTEVGAIVHGTPESVARWFESRWQPPRGQEFTKYSLEDSERSLLEYLAARRREPLIDHAVGRWGYGLPFIQRVYNRGDASTKMAALANPRGGAMLAQAGEIVRSGRLVDLHAMLQNPYLDGSFLDEILCRNGRFAGLPDDRLLWAIWCLKGSKRLASASDYENFDGMSAYYFDRPSSSAWKLALTVPVDPGWASSLDSLLATCSGNLPREKAPEALARWRIDPPLKDGAQWFNRSPSFFLRARLAGALPADGDLLASEDPAMRVSFYRRFRPHEWKDWPNFVERDGSDFVVAAINNENLWRTLEARYVLEEVCGKCFDSSTGSSMHSDFRNRRRQHQLTRPEWFAEQEYIPPPEPVDGNDAMEEILSVQRLMLDVMKSAQIRLDGIDAAIRAIPAPRRGLF